MAERARVLRGTLAWQLDAAYKLRLSRMRNALEDTDAELVEARDAAADLHRLAQQFAGGARAVEHQMAGPHQAALGQAGQRQPGGVVAHPPCEPGGDVGAAQRVGAGHVQRTGDVAAVGQLGDGGSEVDCVHRAADLIGEEPHRAAPRQHGLDVGLRR